MFNFYEKHYIRVENGIVTKGFSSAFEHPLNSDVCINEKGGRHFEINGAINPPMFDERFCHIYRYDENGLRKATQEELDAEYVANYVEPDPTEDELQWQAITDIEIAQMEYEQALTDLEIEVLANE